MTENEYLFEVEPGKVEEIMGYAGDVEEVSATFYSHSGTLYLEVAGSPFSVADFLRPSPGSDGVEGINVRSRLGRQPEPHNQPGRDEMTEVGIQELLDGQPQVAAVADGGWTGGESPDQTDVPQKDYDQLGNDLFTEAGEPAARGSRGRPMTDGGQQGGEEGEVPLQFNPDDTEVPGIVGEDRVTESGPL